MRWNAIENQIEDAAKSVGAEVEKEARWTFATVTSAISAFLGLTNPRWKQFVAEWRVWTWAYRITFLLIAGLITWGGIHYGVRIGNLIGGNIEASRAYAHGDVVRKSDLTSKADQKTIAALQRDVSGLRDTVTQLIGTVERIDGAADELMARIRAIEAREAQPPVQKKSVAKSAPPKTTGSIEPKKLPAFTWPF